LSNQKENLSAEAVRRKQKLKTILSTIGEGIQEIFKAHILEKTGEKVNHISIDNVSSIEKGTSKSRVHFVTYSLNSDVGKHLVNVVVKFSSDEIRFEKEIRNHSKIANVSEVFSGVHVPKILYKSSQNRCIIYEGIDGLSFREAKLDLKDKDLNRDDILGLNPSAGCFWVKNSITTQGNVVEVTKRISNSVAILGGIDMSKSLPYAEDILDLPHLVHWATQQDPKILSNGKPKSVHFPSLKQIINGKNEKTGTPFPRLMSLYNVDVKEAGLVDVDAGQKTDHVNLSRWL